MANDLSKQKSSTSLLSRRPGNDPFRKLQNEINHMFDNFWLEPFDSFESIPETFTPTVDVSEDDKEVRISAELPGMGENDISITIRDNMLTIQGEKKEQEETNENGFYRRESSYGTFRRIIDLPSEVDEDKVEAEFKKGILRIKLPKSKDAQTKTKKINIKSS